MSASSGWTATYLEAAHQVTVIFSHTEFVFTPEEIRSAISIAADHRRRLVRRVRFAWSVTSKSSPEFFRLYRGQDFVSFDVKTNVMMYEIHLAVREPLLALPELSSYHQPGAVEHVCLVGLRVSGSTKKCLDEMHFLLHRRTVSFPVLNGADLHLDPEELARELELVTGFPAFSRGTDSESPFDPRPTPFYVRRLISHVVHDGYTTVVHAVIVDHKRCTAYVRETVPPQVILCIEGRSMHVASRGYAWIPASTVRANRSHVGTLQYGERQLAAVNVALDPATWVDLGVGPPATSFVPMCHVATETARKGTPFDVAFKA